MSEAAMKNARIACQVYIRDLSLEKVNPVNFVAITSFCLIELFATLPAMFCPMGCGLKQRLQLIRANYSGITSV